jgi:anti-sigma factor ChrR (cupin superfamily)
MKIELTQEQRTKLERLWFVYGNNGPKHSHHNHRFIQNILEHGEDTEEFYKNADMTLSNAAEIHASAVYLRDSCVVAVREILNN